MDYSKVANMRAGPHRKFGNFAEKPRLFQHPPLSQISKLSKGDDNMLHFATQPV